MIKFTWRIAAFRFPAAGLDFMSTACTASLKLANAESLFLFRIEGRGKARESKTFHARAEQILLEDASRRVLLDIDCCEHLDSTFLGCLVDLNRRFNDAGQPRFTVSCSPETCRRIFGPTRLESVLSFARPPQSKKLNFEEIAIDESETRDDFGRHSLLCHQRMADIEGPHQRIFADIAERLAEELED